MVAAPKAFPNEVLVLRQVRWRPAGMEPAVMPIRVPSQFGRAVRAGGLTTTATATGVRTWPAYLSETYG